jgi:hypothetical protein
MTKEEIKAKNNALNARLVSAGIVIPSADVQTLRRAEIHLREWAHLERGVAGAKIVRTDEGDAELNLTLPTIGKIRFIIEDKKAEWTGKAEDVCRRNGLKMSTVDGTLGVSKPVPVVPPMVSCRV